MSPRRDGGPDRSPQLTVAAWIFGIAGVLALVVAVVATQAAVAVFGVVALAVSAATYGAQRVRERSAIETEQTLGAGPVMSPTERSEPRYVPPDPAPASSGSTGSWDDDDPEEPEPTISEEDDGTGARPGDQAAANVGAATATDIEADPHTGRSFGESSEDEEVRPPEDDDEAASSEDERHGRVDLTVRRDGPAPDRRDDREPVDDEQQAERSAEARSGDGAG